VTSGPRSRLRTSLANGALAIASLLVFAVGLEAAVRIWPAILPRGTYGAIRYDPELGLRVYDGPVAYNKTNYVVRIPNSNGFLDIEHERAKPAGTVRIGFFGDSYVEAKQVPLRSTFYRQLPGEISGRPVEPFGFGISGWGTLHSLFAYRHYADRYDLDSIVYVFVKNDPGDHSYRFRSDDKIASAILQADGRYEIRSRPPSGDGVWHDGLRRRSLVAEVFWRRWRLLMSQPRSSGEQARADASSAAERRLDQNDLPSTWPPRVRAETEQLTRIILAEFAREVRADRRAFAVLYVPRYQRELSRKLPPRDSWFPWLSRVCAELEIPLIDPSARLRESEERNEPVYDDHWTPAGHAVIASVMHSYFEEQLEFGTERADR
jgi:hypothetical protein